MKRIFILGIFAGLLGARFLHRYVVEGRSMLPSYAPGDRVLAETLTYRFVKPRPGDVVIVRQPGAGDRLDLKRIASGERDTWSVLGDNPAESTDSRQLGPVARREVVGRVLFKY